MCPPRLLERRRCNRSSIRMVPRRQPIIRLYDEAGRGRRVDVGRVTGGRADTLGQRPPSRANAAAWSQHTSRSPFPPTPSRRHSRTVWRRQWPDAGVLGEVGVDNCHSFFTSALALLAIAAASATVATRILG